VNRTRKGASSVKEKEKKKKKKPIAEYKNSIQFGRTNEKGLSLTMFEQHPEAESA
jgi:hypothetical protein